MARNRRLENAEVFQVLDCVAKQYQEDGFQGWNKIGLVRLTEIVRDRLDLDVSRHLLKQTLIHVGGQGGYESCLKVVRPAPGDRQPESFAALEERVGSLADNQQRMQSVLNQVRHDVNVLQKVVARDLNELAQRLNTAEVFVRDNRGLPEAQARLVEKFTRLTQKMEPLLELVNTEILTEGEQKDG